MVLETDHFYSSSTAVSIPFTVEGEMASYNVEALPRLCYLISSSILCYVSTPLSRLVIASGFVVGINGMVSEEVVFFITYSAQPLSLDIVWSAMSEDKTPLHMEFAFSVEVDIDKDHLEPYLTLTNGILNSLQFSGREGVATISPLDMGRVTVTVMKSTFDPWSLHIEFNNTVLHDRCGMEMENDVSSSFMYTSKRPLVVLTAGCQTECVSPIAVTVRFNQHVNGLEARMFSTTGRVLSLVHLEQKADDSTDRFILYLEKASPYDYILLPRYSVMGDEGFYNTLSNTLLIGFREAHSSIVALSSHFTHSNPFEFILSFEGYTVVKEGAEGISCSGCSIVGVMVTRDTLLRVVLKMDNEGTGTVHVAKGYFIDHDGEVNNEFDWEFLYGSCGLQS